jgi:glutamate/aspartate transport system substrate-binding protein
MRTISKLILILAACTMCTTPAAAQDSGTLKKIKDSGALTLGVREASSPFSFRDDKQQYVGYSIDLCMKIVDAVKTHLKMPNLKVNMAVVTSETRIPMIMKGAIDIECGSTTNSLERQKQVSFVVTTFFTGTKLLVKTSSNIKSYKDLKGKSVIVTPGTTNENAIKEINAQDRLGMSFIQAKDHNDAFSAVETGRAAAFPMDDVLLYSMRANAKNPADFAVVGEFLTDDPYAIMLRKNDPVLKKLADGAMIALFKSGEINKIYARWFQSPVPPRNVNLNMPMSDKLKDYIRNPNDNGVDRCGRMKCMMWLPQGV